MRTLSQLLARHAAALMLAIALGGFAGAGAACNTVEGAGRDVQGVGEAVSNTAEETRPY